MASVFCSECNDKEIGVIVTSIHRQACECGARKASPRRCSNVGICFKALGASSSTLFDAVAFFQEDRFDRSLLPACQWSMRSSKLVFAKSMISSPFP